MRSARPILLVFAAMAAAGPAAAQTAASLELQRQEAEIGALRAQQDMAARDAVIQQNELSKLDALARARQASETVQAQSVSPQLIPPPASGAQRSIDVQGLASIPDSRLAESNARVKAAAENRP